MNTEQADIIIHALKIIETRSNDLRIFLEEAKDNDELKFASWTDIKTDIAGWEDYLWLKIKEAEEVGQ